MKKVFAVLVLFVFLFNTGGYYIFFLGLHFNATAKLSQQLDQGNYSSGETYEFKIPLVVPYPIQETGYDRAYGNFEHDGEFYSLVKQKLENDTLYIVCIKNHMKKQLAEAFTEYANVSNDTGNATSKAGNELLSKLIKDFNSSGLPEVILCEGWSRKVNFSAISEATIEMYLEVSSPPPNALFS